MPACPNTCFSLPLTPPQTGMTFVEVLVAVLVLSVGLLGAAMLQLNALKYTDSSRITSQASFIAYDMLDRIRASTTVRDLDLHDFHANVRSFAGAHAKGSVVLSAEEVTVSISWDESRGSNTADARETFTLTSRIGDEPGALQ